MQVDDEMVIPSGYPEIDEIYGVLHRKELVVLTGEKRIALAGQIVINAAKAGFGVLLFSPDTETSQTVAEYVQVCKVLKETAHKLNAPAIFCIEECPASIEDLVDAIWHLEGDYLHLVRDTLRSGYRVKLHWDATLRRFRECEDYFDVSM